jgi:mRNA export factor
MDNTNNCALNDYFVPDLIEDSISQIRFYPSPQINVFATGGWDKKIRIWNVNYQVQNTMNQTQSAQINSSLAHIDQVDSPILSVCWQGQTQNVFCGCTDGSIIQINAQNKTKNILSKHADGCKDLVYSSNLNVLFSGGWDGKLNIWDLRSQNPVLSYQFNNKIYTMSLAHNLLVVGCSDRVVAYFNLAKLQMNQFTPEAVFNSHLNYQTRRVCCFPNGTGYAIGSIEGRIAIKNVNFNMTPKIDVNTKNCMHELDFAFRCHRVKVSGVDDVYPVNDIAFNPQHGTFASCGGDGSYVMWDKESKSRLKQGNIQQGWPLTALDYSMNGDLLVYAVGYDWAKGVGEAGKIQPKVGIHYLQNQEKFPKKK